MLTNRCVAAFAVVMALATAACGGGGDDMGDAGPDVLTAVAIETSAPATARAGDLLLVSCLLIDAAGESFVPPPELVVSLTFDPPGAVEEADDGFIATRVGTLGVSCSIEELMLVDEDPAFIEVSAGAPARTVATVEPGVIVAGQTALVNCEFFDAYGNSIDDIEPRLRANPEVEGNALALGEGTFERAGEYDLHCDLPGAQSEPARLEVTPNLPASLVISPIPESVVYRTDEVIEVSRRVADRFGNRIVDVDVPVTSEPAGTVVSDGRFSFSEDGRYTLTATVSPPTDGDLVLSESLVVVVDTRGPALPCDPALDNAILDIAPGGTLTFTSSVSDTSGVTEVSVDGAVVPLAADGSYSVELTTTYGLNFVRLSATDTTGRESTGLCSFLVSDVWAPDDTLLDDTLSLRLRQEAIDDQERSDPLDSFADVLDTVLNSTALANSIDAALVGANPLKPNGCDQRVLRVCVLRSEVLYQGLRLPGPNTVSLDLVDGGATWRVRIEDLGVRVRIRGHVAGIAYDTVGWVTFDYVQVDMTSDFRLAGGRPSVRVRPGFVSTSVGTIRTSFAGIDGAILNIVNRLFNGTVRNLVAGVVTGFVTDNLNDVLDGVLGGLDVGALGTTFDVPPLDGGATIPLATGFSFSSLSTTNARLLFGLGTRFTAPAAHARPTLGAPVPAGGRLLDVGGTDAAGAAVHEAVIAQAIHALWLGGFFDATIDELTSGGALPAGTELSISTVLPPVVEIVGERVQLSLGAVTVDAVGVTPTPARLVMGVRASMAATLVGDELVFSDFLVDELHFSTNAVDLTPTDLADLEAALTPLAEVVIGGALSEVLPTFAIPTFTLPSSVAAYGLPPGGELAITSPTFGVEAPHFVVRGAFGLR